jgi:CMP-N,N'-diacetyllegionaminic acid synthase
MKTIALIPARGGSQGLPRKNIKILNNKPLIVHTIEDALESQYVDKVFVTTDDQEIRKISQSVKAEVILRPVDLASHTASSELALIHALDFIEKSASPELIIFLQCTSPFRSGNDIDRAIEQFKKEDSDSLLSVSPSHRFLWSTKNGNPIPLNYDYLNRPRRQDMDQEYVENGSIYIFKPWVLRKYESRLGGKISLFKMDNIATIDIDSASDFHVAESLCQKHRDKL